MAKPFFVYNPVSTQLDNSGVLVATGARRFIYQAGTTTKLTTYPTQDDAIAGTNANANPLIADSAGRFGAVWATQACKIVDAPPGTDDPPSSSYTTRDNVTGLGQIVQSKAKTTTYTITTSDRDYLIKCDASSGSFAINLLAAATAGDGFNIKIQKIDSSANTVTVTCNGAETWNGSNTVVLYDQYAYVEGYSDGTQWIQVDNYNVPKGSYQQFVGIGSVIAKSLGTWSVSRGAQSNYSLLKSAADETAIVAIDITNEINTNSNKGFKLKSFDVIYAISTDAMDAHTVTLDKVSHADNTALTITAQTITGTLATATQTNPYVSAITLSTPAYNNTADSHYIVELTVNTKATTIYNFYGLVLKFIKN